MNKKNLLIVGAIIVGLGTGTIIGLTQITNTPKISAKIENSQPINQAVSEEECQTTNTNAVDIEELQKLKAQEQVIRAKYTELIEKEKKEGCFEIYEKGTAKGDFCGESFDKVNKWAAQEGEEINNLYARSESERAKTIVKIKEMINDSNADIVFAHVKPDDRYPDTQMNEVYYDKTNYAWIFVDNKTGEIRKIQGQIVVLDLLDERPPRSVLGAPEKVYSEKETKKIAMSFIEKNIKDFEAKISGLSFQDGFNDYGYYVVWGQPNEVTKAPYLTINIGYDGKVLGFADAY